jgi:hypothetical protein
LVSRWALQIEEFEGFDDAVVDGHTMECLDKVPDLEVKLGNYTVKDTFYVVDLFDTDVVLGVQWSVIVLGPNPLLRIGQQTIVIGRIRSWPQQLLLRPRNIIKVGLPT